jgi:hypothetical protein
MTHSENIIFLNNNPESTTTRKTGSLDFTATGGKRQGREVPQSLRVEPGAKHPVRKTQSSKGPMSPDEQRASQRFVYESALKVENCDSGTYTYGRMYNYSAGGIYFESDVAFQPGTQVRIEIEKPAIDLDTDDLVAMVKWCHEISAAVVLYDYGIGVEFDRSKRDGKFRVIQGGAGPEKT